jgi:hypothetical protein
MPHNRLAEFAARSTSARLIDIRGNGQQRNMT